MNTSATNLTFAAAGFELRFQSLHHQGRALSFPCDDAGRVDIDALSERARNNYYFARTLIGRDFSHPAVQRQCLQ
jgi:hypothetical protein